jgi:hypothetical protein
LCTFAAGYICIDVTGMRWPTEASLRKIANKAAQSATGLPITEDVIHQRIRVERSFPLSCLIWPRPSCPRRSPHVTGAC